MLSNKILRQPQETVGTLPDNLSERKKEELAISDKSSRRSAVSRLLTGRLLDAVTILLTAAAAVSAIMGAFADALPIMLLAIANTAAALIGDMRCRSALQKIYDAAGDERVFAEEDPTADSALAEELDTAGRALTVISLSASVVCFVIGLLRGFGAANSFYTAAALAIASAPHGIRWIYINARSSALRNCLKNGAAVCAPEALEKLASVGVMCVRKCGVVTGGRPSVESLAVLTDKGFCEYKYSEAEGRLTMGGGADGYHAWEDTALSRTLICAALCTDAKIAESGRAKPGRNRGKKTVYEGSPDDIALLRLCSSCGIERGLLLCKKTAQKDFDPETRFTAVTCKEPNGSSFTYAKGAPESIADLCALGENYRKAVDMLTSKYAAEGMRVLAFCMKSDGVWQLLALAALRDSVRPQLAETVRKCRRLGMSVTLMSGDHPLTAVSAARRAGIFLPDSQIYVGSELKKMTDEQLNENVRGISVAARTAPECRKKIVDSLRSRGVVTAYISADADAPAADVTVGRRGSGADMIVEEGGIAQMFSAVRESRRMYGRIKQSVCCMTACTAAMIFSIAGGAAMGLPVVMKTCQLLLVSLILGGLSAACCTFSGKSRESLSSPRSPQSRCFENGALIDSFIRGLLISVAVLASFSINMSLGGGITAARSAAMLTLSISLGLVFAEHGGVKKKLIGALPAVLILLMSAADKPAALFGLDFPGMGTVVLSAALSAAVPAVIYLCRIASGMIGGRSKNFIEIK